MLRVVKTTKEHLDKIKIQPEQADEFVNINIDGMHSIVDDDNNVFMIFKFMLFWQTRGHVESFIAADAGKHLLAIVRILKTLYKKHAPERLEAEILNDFTNAKRFVELFGFKQESVMPKYYNGKTYCMYVKFREDKR